MLESGLRAQLLTIDDLVNVIGQRVYPVTPPEDLLASCPCVVMQTATYSPSYSGTPGSTGLAEKRIVLTALAQEGSGGYSTVRTIIEVIRANISGFQGSLPDGTLVFQIRITNSADYFDSEPRIYRSTLSLAIQYQE